jgi:hypothetical protein
MLDPGSDKYSSRSEEFKQIHKDLIKQEKTIYKMYNCQKKSCTTELFAEAYALMNFSTNERQKIKEYAKPLHDHFIKVEEFFKSECKKDKGCNKIVYDN